MSQLDDVEDAVLNRAKSVAEQGAREGWNSERVWTRNLILALGHLGHKRGYHICGGGCAQYGEGGWLYDLVWLQNWNKFVIDVPLILECEWLTRYIDISQDFEKLLVGRARHRVMVF